ncbi:MAG: hypothetical protein MPK62_01025 [Alphaproteobacteria bacterium]|nr:hypothetical protein [Alphaproteobacteria bacterium]MDA8029717.1 hypothetical protein [Alphaproteobacteria bacterium]
MMDTVMNVPPANTIFYVDHTGKFYDYVDMECPGCNEFCIIRGTKKEHFPSPGNNGPGMFSWAPGDEYECRICHTKFVVLDWYDWESPASDGEVSS